MHVHFTIIIYFAHISCGICVHVCVPAEADKIAHSSTHYRPIFYYTRLPPPRHPSTPLPAHNNDKVLLISITTNAMKLRSNPFTNTQPSENPFMIALETMSAWSLPAKVFFLFRSLSSFIDSTAFCCQRLWIGKSAWSKWVFVCTFWGVLVHTTQLFPILSSALFFYLSFSVRC